MPALIDPKVDIVFKKIFESDQEILKSFLNAVLPLPEDGMIESLEYLTNEQYPTTPEHKASAVDVKCTDQRKRVFIVEMQMNWLNTFSKRISFNTAKAFAHQLKPGRNQNYGLLNPVYALVILNDTFDSRPDVWYHPYRMCVPHDPEDMLPEMQIVMIELPKFKPKTYEEKKLRVLWLRFLKEIQGIEFDQVPAEFHENEDIEQALNVLNEMSHNKEELDYYYARKDLILMKEDLKATIYERGIEKGLEKGLEKGAMQKQIELTQKMFEQNAPIEMISIVTGFTEQEILALCHNETKL